MHTTPALRLLWLPGEFAICRFDAGEALPESVRGALDSRCVAASATTSAARPSCSSLLSVVRTDDEVSVVCADRLVPDGTRAERGFRAFRVAGTLDFGLVGVIARLAAPLADAAIPIFVVSTFDTDHVLVRSAHAAAAARVLRSAGYEQENAP
ncbi:MAG: ACT domain-containing protein [Phycisphaerales bacterium]